MMPSNWILSLSVLLAVRCSQSLTQYLTARRRGPSYLTSLHLPDQPAQPSPAQLLTYLIPMPLQPGREVEMMSRVQFPILASFSFSSSIKS